MIKNVIFNDRNKHINKNNCNSSTPKIKSVNELETKKSKNLFV